MFDSMELVALSIVVLVAAPAVAALLVRRPLLAAMLDSFVLVSVGGIVALHVIPESARVAGAVALLLAMVGLFLPIALHRVDERIAGPSRAVRDVVVLAVFVIGLFVHALFDGAALVTGEVLALGVILHRLPFGVALWVVVRLRLGLARTLVVAAAYAGGTVVGALLGDAVHDASALALVQSFVAGSILHVVFESPPLTPDGPRARRAGLAGIALAAAVMALLPHDDDTLASFLPLALAIAPAALLSFVLVGLLTALYPDGPPRLPGKGVRVIDAAAGVVAGLPHPLCSCSVAPLYRALVDRGATPAGARAFLVAAPELGVPALLLSVRLLGVPFTLLRVLGAALLALAVGVTARGASGADDAGVPLPPLRARLAQGMRHGLEDAVDHIGPWLLLGLFLAAFLDGAVAPAALATLPSWLQALAGALVGLPLYLCAAGTTPIAFVLLGKGAALGGVLALLLVGPAASAPTLALLARLHGTRAALGFVAVLVLVSAALGVLVEQVGVVVRPLLLASAPTVLELVCGGGCAALIVASLLRQGVRGFVVQIMSPQHEHAKDHAHGPGCGHDHGPPLAEPVARVSLSFDPRGRSGG